MNFQKNVLTRCQNADWQTAQMTEKQTEPVTTMEHNATVATAVSDGFILIEGGTFNMGSNPSTFDGDDLPVDNISWLEAVQYANARSNAAGLNPAYTISVRTVNHQSTYC